MKKLAGVVLVLCGFSSGVLSQTPFFHSYFLLRKNDRIQLNSIFEDRKGFMWFGTSAGLFKYDGKKQHRFTKQQGFPGDVVTALAEDSLGRIWVGYTDGKLGFLENNKFISFDPPEGTTSHAISDILFDKNGTLWFSTLDDGLYYFKEKRLFRIDDAEGLPDLYVYDLSEDSRGNIWAGTDGGVAICSLSSKKVSIDVLNYDDGLPDNIIRKIVHEKDHSVLLATEDAGVIRYNVNSKKQEPLIVDPWYYGSVSDFVTKDNKVWIACPQKGLVILDQRSKQYVVHPFNEIAGFNSIRILSRDTEENIWLGTKTGLLRTPGDDIQYLDNPTPAGDANTLALTIDRSNNIWFSNTQGLFQKKSVAGKSEIVNVLGSTSYKKYTVISLFTDFEGFIWAGLYGEGALRINPMTGAIRHLNKELRNGNILSISGSDNVVWLATLGGVSRISIGSNEILTIKNYSSADGLASDFIYQVFVQPDRVWFATDGKGLAMWNTDGFHHYEKGLPNAVIYGMAEDANHKLWVNVQGNGLYVFEGDKFIPIDSALALRDKAIHCLASDRNGNIVVMHDAGLDIIDVHQNKIIYLGDEMGLRDKIANLNAVGKDTLGNLFFGTNEGIVKYAGEQNYLNSRPRSLIENIAVFDKAIGTGQAPVLKYDQNNITIHYLGIWYKNPELLFYSYKLEHYDLNWINSTNLSATYSQLPPGNYTFKVRVSESQNFNDAQEAQISFKIRPPFWRTVPFYIGGTILIISLIYVVIKTRERKLKKDNELLETTVRIRTLEIQRQNEEIQTQNEEISSQSEEILGINENLEQLVRDRTAELERKNNALEEYAFINAHKLRSPVATILGLLNLLPKANDDGEREEISRRLQDTANELDSIVSSITKAIERGFKKAPRRKDEMNS